MKYILILILVILSACTDNNMDEVEKLKAKKIVTVERPIIKMRFIPLAEHFGFPLGYPDGEGYYDANPFRTDGHLGADLNGLGGGDTDFGDTIKAIGNGVVLDGFINSALYIMHRTTDKNLPVIKSFYYHCDTVFVKENDIVKAGQVIALVGKTDTEIAHLHFEIIIDTSTVSRFYDSDTTGYMNPITFIKTHR